MLSYIYHCIDNYLQTAIIITSSNMSVRLSCGNFDVTFEFELVTWLQIRLLMYVAILKGVPPVAYAGVCSD